MFYFKFNNIEFMLKEKRKNNEDKIKELYVIFIDLKQEILN